MQSRSPTWHTRRSLQHLATPSLFRRDSEKKKKKKDKKMKKDKKREVEAEEPEEEVEETKAGSPTTS